MHPKLQQIIPTPIKVHVDFNYQNQIAESLDQSEIYYFV